MRHPSSVCSTSAPIAFRFFVTALSRSDSFTRNSPASRTSKPAMYGAMAASTGNSSISSAVCAPAITTGLAAPASQGNGAQQLAVLLFHAHHRDAAAHRGQHVEQSRASGIQQHAVDHQVRLGKDRGGAQEKRSRRTVSRNVGFERMQRLTALDGHRASHPVDFGAEGAQRKLSVIARADWFRYRRMALSEQSGKQQRRLDLSAGDRNEILDAMQAGTGDAQRRTATFAGMNLGAHPGQGLDDPAHRPTRE